MNALIQSDISERGGRGEKNIKVTCKKSNISSISRGSTSFKHVIQT